MTVPFQFLELNNKELYDLRLLQVNSTNIFPVNAERKNNGYSPYGFPKSSGMEGISALKTNNIYSILNVFCSTFSLNFLMLSPSKGAVLCNLATFKPLWTNNYKNL